MTDSLKVWYILRKRAIFYRDDFPLEGKFSGGGGRLFSRNFTRGNLGEFKYKFAHSPHDK